MASTDSASSGIASERQGSVPRAPQFTAVFGGLGAASMAFTNALRSRPLLYQPWLHLGLGLVGAYAGFRLANIYDDTTDTLNRQLSAYAALPSWAHSQLSSDDLNAELREKRKAQLREKVQALAAIEEAEFKAKLQGMGAEELQEARARGAVRLMA